MLTDHRVQAGDHLARVAYLHGHRKIEDIWHAPENSGLRDKRPDPGVLAPGDLISVPEAAPFEFHGLAVGRRHTLEVDLPYPRFRIELAYANEAPVVGPEATITISSDGDTTTEALDGEGRMEFELGPFTETVTLAFQGRTLVCSVATLQPIESFAGIHARLSNLGYEPGRRRGQRSRDGVAFLSAVQEFQCDHGLEVDGDPGDKTREKLLEVCGA